MKVPTRVWHWGALAGRVAMGGFFIYASAEKLLSPSAFVESIANYQILPAWSPYAAVTIPAVELLSALALICGTRRFRVAAAATLAGLLVMFTLALTRAWSIGLNVECGCFGNGSSHIGPESIVRNLLLLGVLAVLARMDGWGLPVPPPSTSATGTSGSAPRHAAGAA